MTPLLLAVLAWHFNWSLFVLVGLGSATAIGLFIAYLFFLAWAMEKLDDRFGAKAVIAFMLLAIGLIFGLVAAVVPAHSSTIPPVLSWTAPAFHSTAGSCLPSQDPIVDPESVYVWRQQQSPTWIAMRPAMIAFPAVWEMVMPIVREEAEPRLFSVRGQVPGVRDSISIPDSTGWFYRAEVIVNGKWALCPAWVAR